MNTANGNLPALDDAIRAYVAAEYPDQLGAVAHWRLVVGALATDDDDMPLVIEAPDGQPGYVSAGLLHAALHPDDYEQDE